MNHLYRVIWNSTLNCWQAVAETAKGKTKSSRRTARTTVKSHRKTTLSITLLGSLCAMNVMALPTGGAVVAGTGTATIATSGTTMTINQTTAKASINWSSFSLGTTDTVNFTQPSASAITLNRVTGTTSSSISGKINANGQVFILNPNGILTNNTAQINVGGLVASTLALSDSNFLAGSYNFVDTTNTKTVENKGAITVATGGTVALIAPTVKHSGTITAPQGNAFLAAAGNVTITLNNGSPISYTINQGKAQALINTGGMISASGGTVILTAQGIDALSSAVVNAGGTIEAKTVSSKKGVIQLLSDMDSGTVNVSGTLDASSPSTGTAGGLIKTDAATVNVASNTVITTKKAGQTSLPSTGSYWELRAKDIDVEVGGTLSGATLGSALQNGNVSLYAVNTAGGQGNIAINEDSTWNVNTALTLNALGDINVNSELKGTADSAKLVMAYGTGHDYNISEGAKITLSGAAPLLSINGTAFTVINQLGEEQDANFNTLQGINNNLSGNYALGTDIDASDTVNWNSGAGFAPIGGKTVMVTTSPALSSQTISDTPFTGQFHGLGHSINNLTIDHMADIITTPTSTTYSTVGLFGATTNIIRDAGLVDGNIYGYAMVGGLVGLQESGTIRHSYAQVNVKGVYDVGGLVGTSGLLGSSIGGVFPTGVASSTGVITDSYTSGTVSGVNQVGGLVGENHSLINNSHSDSNLNLDFNSSGASFGGLVGGMYDGNIINSYATGSITGNISGAGGLLGTYTAAADGVHISNSYATGNLDIADNAGGLIGNTLLNFLSPVDPNSTILIENSYATGNVTGSHDLGGLVGGSSRTNITNSYASGNVTGSDYLGGLVGSALIRTNITGSSAAGAVTGASYVGGLIGRSDGATQLNTISTSSASGAVQGRIYVGGLIGNNAHANIDHSFATGDVAGVSIGSTYSFYVGGLVGTMNSGTEIDSSYATGAVTGHDYLGGLVGQNSGTIHDSYATGTMNGDASVGGLAGQNSGLISASHATGTVTGLAATGGLVGSNGIYTQNIGSITDSYAIGAVYGYASVGGLVGQNFGAIANSYATGTAIGEDSPVGGLAGDNFGSIANSYATGDVTGHDYTGGLVGNSQGSIDSSYATGIVQGNDFTGGLAGFSDGNITHSYATGAVNGHDRVGGLVGLSNNSIAYDYKTIDDSYATGAVTGLFAVGGLVGSNIGSNVSRSHATGTVVGDSSVGGLIGSNYRDIDHSYATGTVTGHGGIGGLVGSNDGNIHDSYATGAVSGDDAVGGLIGEINAGYDNNTISNTYASGAVTGTNHAGGLIGGDAGGNGGLTMTSVANSFWNIDTSGQTTSIHGIGKTNTEMAQIATYAGWDIADISDPTSTSAWVIDEGVSAPTLR